METTVMPPDVISRAASLSAGSITAPSTDNNKTTPTAMNFQSNTTRVHSHTTTSRSPPPAKVTFSNQSEQQTPTGQARRTNRIRVTFPPPLTRSPDARLSQLEHGSAYMFNTDAVTLSLSFNDMTPSFHTGTNEAEMHCEDCEILPRGVGLAISAVFGSAFFVLYLLIVTLIWQKCPSISKPPDARFRELQAARRPTFRSRLLLMAQQAAGGLGVPLANKPPVTTTHEPVENKASDIVHYWARLAGGGGGGGIGRFESFGYGSKKSLDSQHHDASSFFRPKFATPMSLPTSPPTRSPPFLHRDLSDDVIITDDNDNGTGNRRLVKFSFGPDRAASDTCITAADFVGHVLPPHVEAHLRRSFSAGSSNIAKSPELELNQDNTDSKSNMTMMMMAENDNKSKSTTSSNSCYNKVCSPKMSQKSTSSSVMTSPSTSKQLRRSSKRRKAKLSRQSAAPPKKLTFSPTKWVENAFELDSPVFNSPPPHQPTSEPHRLVRMETNDTTSTILTTTNGSPLKALNPANDSMVPSEFGDFVILLPRSSTLPVGTLPIGNHLVPRRDLSDDECFMAMLNPSPSFVDYALSPIKRLANRRPPTTSLISKKSATSGGESGIFMLDETPPSNRLPEIWVSKLHKLSCEDRVTTTRDVFVTQGSSNLGLQRIGNQQKFLY